MTQDEKRIAFHKLIDNVFDSGEVFDWAGTMEVGARGTDKPSTFLLIYNPETSPEKAISGDLYDWRDGSKMEWGKFKP